MIKSALIPGLLFYTTVFIFYTGASKRARGFKGYPNRNFLKLATSFKENTASLYPNCDFASFINCDECFHEVGRFLGGDFVGSCKHAEKKTRGCRLR